MSATPDKQPTAVGKAAAEWGPYALSAGVPADASAARTDHARAIAVGKYLAGNVGRRVPVAVDGRSGSAVVRAVPGRARKTYYHVEVTWDGGPNPDEPAPGLGCEPGGQEASPFPPPPTPAPPVGAGNGEEWG